MSKSQNIMWNEIDQKQDACVIPFIRRSRTKKNQIKEIKAVGTCRWGRQLLLGLEGPWSLTELLVACVYVFVRLYLKICALNFMQTFS